MRALATALLCVALASCSQTPTAGEQAAAGNVPARAARAPAAGGEACEKAIQDRANAAALGGAIGMVGGFGGFGGRGGAVAAQVASTAGNMVANSQAQQAQAAVMRDCGRRAS